MLHYCLLIEMKIKSDDDDDDDDDDDESVQYIIRTMGWWLAPVGRAAAAAAADVLLGTTDIEALRLWTLDLGGPVTTPVVPSPRTARTTVVVDARCLMIPRGPEVVVTWCGTTDPARVDGATEPDRVPGGWLPARRDPGGTLPDLNRPCMHASTTKQVDSLLGWRCSSILYTPTSTIYLHGGG